VDVPKASPFGGCGPPKGLARRATDQLPFCQVTVNCVPSFDNADTFASGVPVAALAVPRSR